MATKVNLVVDQGADFTTTITLTNDDGSTFDLTDYSAASQMNNSVTAAMTSGRYVYDLELTDSSNVVSRIVEGTVTVTPQVTSS